jgi:hypothetical protein
VVTVPLASMLRVFEGHAGRNGQAAHLEHLVLPGWQPLPPLPEQARLARARHAIAIATATMDTRFFDTVHTPSRVMDVAEHPDTRKQKDEWLHFCTPILLYLTLFHLKGTPYLPFAQNGSGYIIGAPESRALQGGYRVRRVKTRALFIAVVHHRCQVED